MKCEDRERSYGPGSRCRCNDDMVWTDGVAFCPCGGEIEYLTTCGHRLTQDEAGRVIAIARPMDGDDKAYCVDCEREFAIDVDAIIEDDDDTTETRS